MLSNLDLYYKVYPYVNVKLKGPNMKIGEIAKETGMTVRAIRYYEELNLIKSRRLYNNYRDYDKEEEEKNE